MASNGTHPADPGRTLAVAAAGTLLVLAIFSALVVTVGDSARSLHAGVAVQTWALSGMSLGLAAALLTAGALADDVGHRRVLIWSAGLLAAASAAAALAPSMAALVAARVLQGVAGGGVLAAALGSIGRAFPDHGGAAGVALVVTLASGAGPDALVRGWNVAALVSAGLCALGALIVAGCRTRRPLTPPAAT